MSKIKPLIISRTLPYLGGREVVVDMLIRAFSKKGPICVLTPDKYSKQKNVTTFNTNRDFADILKWAEKQKITIINCHTFYLSDLAFYLSRELEIPIVFTLHGVFIDFYGKKYGKLLKTIYSKSNKVVTVSDNYRKNLGKYVGDSSKLITIKNGIDLQPIDKLSKKSVSNCRKSNRLPQDKFIIMTPARLTYLKGLDYLIDAAKKITDKDILFLICSPNGRKNQEESAYKNKLRHITKQSRANVKFLNLNQKKVLEYYKCADVVLLPSLIEGLSMAVLEALAFRKTVVTTRVGGNAEIINNKENGYLIKPKDSKALIKILLKIKKQPKKFFTGKQGRQTVEKNFIKDTMVENYHRLFKQIINENK
jgi:glycosyltransferase involved in cell wall biosynthesis